MAPVAVLNLPLVPALLLFWGAAVTIFGQPGSSLAAPTSPLRVIIGIPLVIAGLAALIYGAYLFLRDTARVFSTAQMQENVQIITKKKDLARVKQARQENLRLLLSAWKTGLGLMALAFLIFAIAGWFVNH